ALRPAPAWADYRLTGVDDLYLTGASTHPGGGVFGASGRTAARVILRDCGRRSRVRSRPRSR
ncbi:MAG TPA: NAD(P)/FAD-dependent oxidoreductase, partial [Mycobacteriales bacterium]|nr:NAD(P)/FAD-dependent oxidoreductase [Mycobacteriales bacterium]